MNKKPERIEWMPHKEVASLLGVHEMTLYGWVQTGHFVGYKIGGRWVYDPRDVEAYIAKARRAKAKMGLTKLDEEVGKKP